MPSKSPDLAPYHDLELGTRWGEIASDTVPPALGSSGSPVDTDGSELTIEEQLFEDHLVQEWLDQPDIYRAFDHRDRGNDLISSAYLHFLDGQVGIEEAIRKIPGFGMNVGVGIGIEVEGSVDVGGYLRESAKLEQERFQAARRRAGRKEMLIDYDRVRGLARHVRVAAFQRRGGQDVSNPGLLEVLDEAKAHGQLPDALSPGAIRANHPDLANAFHRLGLHDPNSQAVRDLRAGSITVQQFFAQQNLTVEQAVEVVLESMAPVATRELPSPSSEPPDLSVPASIPDQYLYTDRELLERERQRFQNEGQAIVGRLDGMLDAMEGERSEEAEDRRAALLDQKARVERALDTFRINLQLEAHQAEVEQAGRVLHGAGALLGLVDPKLGTTLQTAARGGLQIYDAVGSMVIAGAMSFSGVGAALGGAMKLMSAFDSSPSQHEVTMKALGAILRNQQRMLEKLHKIEQKVDVLQHQVDYLAELSRKQFDVIRRGHVELHQHLADLQEDVYTVASNLRLDIQGTAAVEVRTAAADLIGLLTLDVRRFEARTIRRWASGGFESDPPQIWTNVQEDLSRMATFVTKVSKEPPFVTERVLRDLSMPELVALKPGHFAERVGLLPSVAEYVGAARFQIEAVSHLGHPSYLSEIAADYFDAACMLPRLPFRDARIRQVATEVRRWVRATRVARTLLPSALDVYRKHVESVLTTLNQYLKEMAQRWPPKKPQQDLPLYAEMTRHEIEKRLEEFSMQDLHELARRFGFTNTRSYTRVTAAKIDYFDGCPPLWKQVLEDGIASVATEALTKKEPRLTGDLFVIQRETRVFHAHGECPEDGVTGRQENGRGAPPPVSSDEIANRDRLKTLFVRMISERHTTVVQEWNKQGARGPLADALTALAQSARAFDSLARFAWGDAVFAGEPREWLSSSSDVGLLLGVELQNVRDLPTLMALRARMQAWTVASHELPEVEEMHALGTGDLRHAVSKLKVASWFDDLLPAAGRGE